MLKLVLPSGWLGLVLASLTAAYMSTISTHLNWGSSYVVNDFYKRFLRPEAPEKELVLVGRISTVIMMVIAGIIALKLSNALQGFQILLQIGAGTGLIFILRWFWWRVNAISELVAMTVSFIVAVSLQLGDFGLQGWQELLLGIGLTTVAWVGTAFLSKPAEMETLKAFCCKINPGGPGWKPVYAAIREEGLTVTGEAVNLPKGILSMVAGCALVYSALIATGYWLYGQSTPAAILTTISVSSLIVIQRLWKS